VERYFAERSNRVRPITRVPLRQRRTGNAVLEPSQDAVADELVRRHAAATRAALVEHAGAEHGVGLSSHEGRDHLRKEFRGVLPITVQQYHDVEIVVDGPPVAGLLVPAVTQVLGIPNHLDR
jgi:hypothetical protein